VAFRNESAARRPASPTDQPIQAWAADSTKTLQSRSMRLSNACVSGALIASHPREDPPNNTRRVTRSGWSAAYAMACVHELEAEECEALDACLADDGIEIAQHRVERQVRDVAL